jgi:CitMHS family citrate-Mg2+:H+ or citrate-Ca2+:H+ symporter
MLTFLGLSMIACFIAAIMTQRLSALVALILMPLAFGLLAGHGADLGPMALAGITKLAPTAVLLVFAVLYFAVMIDTGLFDPLVRRVVRYAGGDPLRICVGTAVVVLLVSLDGDGASTALLTIATFLPIYRRTGMNPLILAVILGAANSIVNITPWGGPTGRVASALHLDPADVFLPLLPTMLVGMAATVVLAVYLGLRERQRLGIVSAEAMAAMATPDDTGSGRDMRMARPRLIWVNLVLTLCVLATGFARLLPLPVAFMVGIALALAINYPKVSLQRDRLAAHAANALPIALLIFGAGIFTGVMGGTGMIDAIAKSAAAAIPPELGPRMGWITALLSGPLTFALPNDAYYFGVVPVVAHTAGQFGVSAAEIARASLLGQPLHTLSPLVASLYFVAGLLDREVGELQRYAFKWMLLITLVMVATAIASGAIG